MSKILTLNVGGILSPTTQLSFLKCLRESEINIAMVQETNQRDGATLDVLKNVNRYDIYSSPGYHRGSGRLTMVSCTSCIHDVSFSVIYPGYSAALIFRFNLTKYTLVNIYLPHDQSIAIDILSATKNFLLNTNVGCIVVGGDFKCVLEPHLDRTSGVETHIAVANSLTNFVSFFNLSDPFPTNFPTTLSYTRIVTNPNRFSASRIDRFYVSSAILNSIKNVEHIVCPFSDHHSVPTSEA